jgi:hypothetical protein
MDEVDLSCLPKRRQYQANGPEGTLGRFRELTSHIQGVLSSRVVFNISDLASRAKHCGNIHASQKLASRRGRPSSGKILVRSG